MAGLPGSPSPHSPANARSEAPPPANDLAPRPPAPNSLDLVLPRDVVGVHARLETDEDVLGLTFALPDAARASRELAWTVEEVLPGAFQGRAQPGDELWGINGEAVSAEWLSWDVVASKLARRPADVVLARARVRGSSAATTGSPTVHQASSPSCSSSAPAAAPPAGAARRAGEEAGAASASPAAAVAEASSAGGPSSSSGARARHLAALHRRKGDILAWMREYDICFIEAATGMGKSTLIPQYVVEEDEANIVWQLQPRRLAAKRLAQFVASERDGALGGEVGYRVRGEQEVSDATRLTYMTCGYFLHFVLHHLQHLQGHLRGAADREAVRSAARQHRWCTHLFIDEVHEASEEVELILLLMKMLAHRGILPFKVVILSATLDFASLHDYFVRPPDLPQAPRPEPVLPSVAPEVLELVQDTPFPVTIAYFEGDGFSIERHRLGILQERYFLAYYVDHILREWGEQASRQEVFSALVFLPGIAEIDFFHRVYDEELARRGGLPAAPGLAPQVVVLHSITLSATCEIQRPPGDRAVLYLASSVAETSLTLPNLTHVYDLGLSRGSAFDPVLEMEQLTTKMGSTTSARQRAGRVGRTMPGKVFRMYPRAVYDMMPSTEVWSQNGTKRSLEATVLLVSKTLVRFLGMDIRTCLSLLVQTPADVEVDAVLTRLEELDAITLADTPRPELTAFGEFAVCVAILGPRLARLVYCGLVMGRARLAVALAAIAAVCGKSELTSLPSDFRGGSEQTGASADGTTPADLQASEERALTGDTVAKLFSAAEYCADIDGGCLSEPIMALRMFQQYLDRNANRERISMYKLRQIEGLCRELGTKLKAMCQDQQRRRQWRPRNARPRVLSSLCDDAAFFSIDYEKPLAPAWPEASRFLHGCLRAGDMLDVRLLLCVAFPANFIIGSLSQKADLPPLTLQGGPPELTEDALQRAIQRTLPRAAARSEAATSRLEVRAEADPIGEPSSFQLVTAGDSKPGGQRCFGDIIKLSAVAVLNMVAQRDQSRLNLFMDDGQVQVCGYVVLNAVWEFRLMRMPELSTRPAWRMSPLSRMGPIAGLGPEGRRPVAGEEAHCIGIAMDLEAVRLHQRQGRLFRSGKAARTWLASVLPSERSLDLALLLAFWSRGFILHEPADAELDKLPQYVPADGSAHSPPKARPIGSTVYAAVTVGAALTVQFPPDAPLTSADWLELRRMNCSIQVAHRTGNIYREHLPSVLGLQEWAVKHLTRARVHVCKEPSKLPTLPPRLNWYSHRTGFGALKYKEAHSEVVSMMAPVPMPPPAAAPSPPRVRVGETVHFVSHSLEEVDMPWERRAAAAKFYRLLGTRERHRHLSVLAGGSDFLRCGAGEDQAECVVEAPEWWTGVAADGAEAADHAEVSSVDVVGGE